MGADSQHSEADHSGGHVLAGIELADAVAAVRDQLVEAAVRGSGRPLSFEVGDISMEFTLELRREIKGGGKVRAWVVEAGADASHSTGRTHRVSFTLSPRDARTNAAWRVGNDHPGSTAGFGQDTPVPGPTQPGR